MTTTTTTRIVNETWISVSDNLTAQNHQRCLCGNYYTLSDGPDILFYSRGTTEPPNFERLWCEFNLRAIFPFAVSLTEHWTHRHFRVVELNAISEIDSIWGFLDHCVVHHCQRTAHVCPKGETWFNWKVARISSDPIINNNVLAVGQRLKGLADYSKSRLIIIIIIISVVAAGQSHPKPMCVWVRRLWILLCRLIYECTASAAVVHYGLILY